MRTWLVGPTATRVAWGLWVLLFVGASIRALGKPSGVTRVYRDAANLWLDGKDLYTDTFHGYLYLPHCAVLSQPLLWGPFWLTEIAWRLFTVGTFAWAVQAMCERIRRETGVPLFAMVTMVGIWPVLGAAGNGQCSLPMAALMIVAVLACAERRWWWATGALLLATAFKPLALVLVLLAGAVYGKSMSWRLVVGLAVLFAAPFLVQSPDYVWRQYELAVTKMGVSGSTETSEFMASDISGLLASFGIATEPWQLLPVRAAAALATLWLAWLGRRRWPELQAALLLLALATSYLMVWNPRSESNTYAVVAPSISVLAASEFLIARRSAALPITVLVLLGTCNVFRPVLPGVQYWLKPAAVLVFVVWLAGKVLRRPAVDRP